MPDRNRRRGAARHRQAGQDGDAARRHRRAADSRRIRSRLPLPHRWPNARVRPRCAHGDHDRRRADADRPDRGRQRQVPICLPAGGGDRRRRESDDRARAARRPSSRRCDRPAHRQLPGVRNCRLAARPAVGRLRCFRHQVRGPGRTRRNDGKARQLARPSADGERRFRGVPDPHSWLLFHAGRATRWRHASGASLAGISDRRGGAAGRRQGAGGSGFAARRRVTLDVMLWFFAIGFGLLLGIAGGGTLSNLARLKLRSPWLLVAAVVVRDVVIFSPLSRVEGAQYVYSVSLALIVLWTIWHLKLLPGVWLVTAGGVLNLVVVVANAGRMPVAPDLALSQLGGALNQRGHIGQYTLMGPDTHLNWLGDWVSLRPLPEAYSPGDLLIAIGIALVILVVLHRRRESDGVTEKPENV